MPSSAGFIMCIYRKFFNYYAIQIALNVADFLHSLFKNVNPSSVFILLLIFFYFLALLSRRAI